MPIWGKRKSYILQIVNLDSPLDIMDYSYPLCKEFRIEDDKVKKEPILQALLYLNKEVKLYNKALFKYLNDLNVLLESDNMCISIDDVITVIRIEIKNLYINKNYNHKYNCTNPPQRWFYINSNQRSNILNDQLFKYLFEYINVKCIDKCGSDKKLIRYELDRILYNLQETYCDIKKEENDMKNFEGFVDINEKIEKQDICNNLQVNSKGGTTSDQRVFIKEFVNKLFEEYGIKLGKVEISIYDYKKIDDKEFKKITIVSKDTFKEFIKNSNYTMDAFQYKINNLTFTNDRVKEAYEILAMFIIFQPGDIKITINKSHILVPMLNLPQYNSHQIYLRIDFYALQKLLGFENSENLKNIIPVKENLEENYIIDLY